MLPTQIHLQAPLSNLAFGGTRINLDPQWLVGVASILRALGYSSPSPKDETLVESSALLARLQVRNLVPKLIYYR